VITLDVLSRRIFGVKEAHFLTTEKRPSGKRLNLFNRTPADAFGRAQTGAELFGKEANPTR
jgi:hypothetical protein